MLITLKLCTELSEEELRGLKRWSVRLLRTFQDLRMKLHFSRPTSRPKCKLHFRRSTLFQH